MDWFLVYVIGIALLPCIVLAAFVIAIERRTDRIHTGYQQRTRDARTDAERAAVISEWRFWLKRSRKTAWP